MEKRTRTILFSVCVVLFLLVAPLIVLYSQGYRFDFENKKVVQTGALYFRVNPGNAQVYLNNKLRDNTSFFTNSSLVENLLPKIYQIEIKKPGYFSWQKNLEVKEKQVTEAKNILLIPENPNLTILSTGTREINEIVSRIKPSATSSDKKKVIESNNYEIWISFLDVPSDEPKEESANKIFLTRFSEKIGNIFWLNNHYLIFNVGDKVKVSEIDTRNRINIIDLAEFKSPEIFWDNETKNLYILSDNKVYLSENLLP